MARSACALRSSGSARLRPFGRDGALDEAEAEVDGEGDERDDDRRAELAGVAVGLRLEDRVAERLDVGQRRDRRGGDDRDRGRADAAEDRRQRQRQLDLADDLALGQPDAARGVDASRGRPAGRRRRCW